MKKKAILALTMAGLVALQMPMVALADDIDYPSGYGQISDSTTDINSDGVIKVNGDVTGSYWAIAVQNKNVQVEGNVHACVSDDSTVLSYGTSNWVHVSGEVENSNDGYAIVADNGTEITAGSVTSGNGGSSNETIRATDSTVIVDGAVENKGFGTYSRAISASASAGDTTIVIAGSATNGVEGQEAPATIKASGSGTTVIIEAKDGVEGATGDVTNKSTDNGAVWADEGATIVIEGTAKNNSAQETITLTGENSKVIVYKFENTGVSSQLIAGDEQNVFYIIKGTDSEGIDLARTTGLTSQTVLAGTTYEKTYQTAKGDEEIKVAVASGYEVKAGTIQVTKNADGTYSIKVPVGGGVTLETIKKAVEAAQAQEEEKKATVTGTEGSAVGGGSWNMGPGGYWTYRNNGIFRDTWGYITLENGKTGWFWFDQSGVMATGWKEIGGKWYYFNEVHDGTYGMMLSNTTTPDGKKVGADGALVE